MQRGPPLDGGIGERAWPSADAARTRQQRLAGRQVRQQVIRVVSTAAALARTLPADPAAEGGVADAEGALTVYRQRLELGIGIPLDSITAEETLTQARLDHLDAVVGYDQAWLRLLRALGDLR